MRFYANKLVNVFILFITINLLVTSPSALANDESIDIRYIVNIFGSNLGEVHTTIKNKGNKFSIDSTTKAEGAASFIMGGDLIQKCSFEAKDKRINIQSSFTEKLGKKSFTSRTRLDRKSNKILFDNGSDTQSIDTPLGYIVDSCNFQFAAAFTDTDILKSLTTYVIDGKKNRIKGYVFKSEETEDLKTVIGDFKTTKITLERELNPEKKFIFWVAKEHPYFPLKMINKRKSRSEIMTIKSIN